MEDRAKMKGEGSKKNFFCDGEINSIAKNINNSKKKMAGDKSSRKILFFATVLDFSSQKILFDDGIIYRRKNLFFATIFKPSQKVPCPILPFLVVTPLVFQHNYCHLSGLHMKK